MARAPKGHGARFFDKVAKERGISKSRIYKILALQRLCDEVKRLGDEGKIRESTLIEISKVETPARQKLLADLVLEKNLTVEQTREMAKLIRAAESAPPDQASDLWDQFFELKDAIDSKGMTDSLTRQVKKAASTVEVAEKPAAAEPDVDPELRKALGFPELVECVSGRGLDIGTTNIVSAGKPLDGSIHFVLQRNAFLDVRNDSFTKRMLIKLGIDHVMHDNRMYVIGDPAFELANIFEKETRRPMKDGLVSPLETDSLQMISMIIHQCLGNPREQGELVYYCVPADPIDADRNVIYHRGALETVLRRQGFTAKSMIEGHAVVMSELEQEDFTGIGISCGGGMFNVCVAYKSVPALTFSTSRGGDWVDINVGRSLGIPASQATAMKESGVDLTKPRNRQEEAICIYYRELIHYTLTTMLRQMESVDLPTFPNPVELVCAGGTSLVKGFIKVFEEEYEKVLFPIEVKRIRLARDPLRSVANGCLTAAQEEMAIRTGARPEPEAPTLESGQVVTAKSEVVTKPKEARKKKGKDEKVHVLPAKLPNLAPQGGGFKTFEQKTSLPKTKEPVATTNAGPTKQSVSLPKPKPKDLSEMEEGPSKQVVSLPRMKDVPEGPSRGGRTSLVDISDVPGKAPDELKADPEAQPVDMSDAPVYASGEATPLKAQSQSLPPVKGIGADGGAPVAMRPTEEVTSIPDADLAPEPAQELTLDGSTMAAAPAEPAADVTDETAAAEPEPEAAAEPAPDVAEEATVAEPEPETAAESVPDVAEEAAVAEPEAEPVQEEGVDLDYPSDAIEQALAAAAALDVTGEPVIEPVPAAEPVAEEQPAETLSAEEQPAAEPAVEEQPVAEEAPADEGGGVELAPFIQQGSEEGETAPEEQPLSDTDWTSDEGPAAPEDDEAAIEEELPPDTPDMPGDDEPPPLPPMPSK